MSTAVSVREEGEGGGDEEQQAIENTKQAWSIRQVGLLLLGHVTENYSRNINN